MASSLVFLSISALVLTMVPPVVPAFNDGLVPMNKSDVHDENVYVISGNRNKRWISDLNLFDTLSDINVSHPFLTNSWYRYATYQAKSRGRSNCYVCSYIPVSTTQPRLTATPMTMSNVLCYLAYSVLGSKDSKHCPTQLVKRFTTMRNETPVPMYAEYTSATIFPYCFTRNGTRKLGQIPRHNCNHTLGPQCPHRLGVNACDHTNMAPGNNGTFNLEFGFWLCGYKLYTHLPPDWDGVCAPVHVTDHTYIVSTVPSLSRRKRKSPTPLGFNPHDAIWGVDVPPEHKLWTNRQTGDGKTFLQMETLDYRFKSFVNMTYAAITGFSEENTSTRLMVLQDTLVLDLLIAVNGGVCAMVGTSCCTFIPENPADYQMIAEAVKNISKLTDAMNKDQMESPDWLNALLAGWRPLLVQIAVAVLIKILILCCVIPIIARRLSKRLERSMIVDRRVCRTQQQSELRPDMFHINVFDSDCEFND